MATQYKTNIKCSGCVALVTPHLNEAVGEGNWSVNLNDPQRILTVTGTRDDKVEEALKKAGYQAEPV
jgi:copper chaperone